MHFIKYVGKKPEFNDHLFGTGLTWHPGQIHPVSADVSAEMAQFPTFEEVINDDRSLANLVEDAPEIQLEQEEDGDTYSDVPLVDLGAMTKPALMQFAHQRLGLALSSTAKKSDLIESIRLQMGKRGN